MSVRHQLQSLQILRAVAATSVVYFHTFMDPHVGSFGVDLFFVLSGLVIAMLAEGRGAVGEFVINRITRVVPLYWLLTIVMLVAAAVAPALLNSTTADWSNFLKSIFFIPYFKENGSLTPMLAVGWTLNYEMLFYTLAAMSLFLSRWMRSWFTASILVLVAWVVGMLLPDHSAFGDFLSSDLLFEFVLGMLAWRTRHFLQAVPWAVGLAIIAVLMTLMVRLELAGPIYRSLTYGLPSFVIVAVALRLEPALVRANQRVIMFLCHVGDASYATYLSHLFVIEFLRKVVVVRIPVLTMDEPLGATLAIVISLAVGSLIYIALDKPMVAGSRSLARRLGAAPGSGAGLRPEEVLAVQQNDKLQKS
jgi:exopolysaccharide production protein ExoZ